MTDRLRIGLGFQLTTYTGWGVVGMNIALALSAMPDVELWAWDVDLRGLTPLDALRLAPIVERSNREWAKFEEGGNSVLIRAEGNQCDGVPTTKTRCMGLMVFEDTSLLTDQAKLDHLREYTWLVTASRWNHELLLGAGVPNTLVQQGIDPTIWHPAPKSGRFRDRFIVFSGGKLEYRKGQDIVLAAFREFQRSHPEALLVTAWGNNWPQLAIDMTLNGHVDVEPEVLDGRVDVEGWCADNGLPDGSYIDVGMQPNVMLAPIVREADVAVFASRAEGGTNLMAMEAIAVDVPTIVSGNTGHMDLEGGAIRVLETSAPKQPSKFFGEVSGWGETAPDALAMYLNDIHGSPNVHAEWLPPSWAEHTNRLVELIRERQYDTWNLDTARSDTAG